MRLLLHRHQQGGGPQEAAPEAGQYPGCWLREVHPNPVLWHTRLQSRRQADPLPLQEVSVRCPRPVPDGGPQVQTHERVAGVRGGSVPVTGGWDVRRRARSDPAAGTCQHGPGDVGNSDSDSQKLKFNLNSISSLIIFTVIHPMPNFNVKPLTHSLKGPSPGQFKTVYLVISFTQPICDLNASSECFRGVFQENFARCFSDNQHVPEWPVLNLNHL